MPDFDVVVLFSLLHGSRARLRRLFFETLHEKMEASGSLIVRGYSTPRAIARTEAASAIYGDSLY